jgi:alkanesulfonate monooxygenase SsuD/methylene tetrahydromethanopterin reductase-like flavin-dependent oxidoreductase (luciferase family)
MSTEGGAPLEPIRWGYKLPSCGGVLCPPEWANPQTIEDLAAAAHGNGFDSLWLHDHLVVPAELRHLEQPSFFEPLVTATRLASLLPTAVVGVATIVLPFREPVLLAKQITTMAAFFPGRVIVGIGIGRYESEFDALGLDTFHSRGRVTDESLAIIRALFTEPSVDHAGERRTLREAVMYPKPVAGDPALWIAGNSAAGARRAGRFGDGWIIAAVPPDEVRTLIGEATAAVPAGRAFTPALSATVKRARDDGLAEARAGLHTHAAAIAGGTEEVVRQLAEYADAGIRHFVLSLGGDDLERLRDDVAWFGEEVIPGVRALTTPALEPLPG